MPWHLDILDQESSSIYNGIYSPIGDGDGVDIYILDTGMHTPTVYVGLMITMCMQLS